VINDIVLMRHPSAAWPGASELRTAQDGLLLAVTREPLVDAARRLRQEGFSDHVMIIIADANGVAPDQCGRIRDLLA
jgi:hypothetical protein